MTGAVLGSTASLSGMTAQQIYENFQNATGPGGLQQAQNNLQKVMKKYEVRSRQISSLSGMMQEGWTGGAADAASRSVRNLAASHADAATAMGTASSLIENQCQAFFDTKNRVVPVPEIPQTPPALKDLIGDSHGGWSQMAKVAAANAAAKQNTEAMQTWSVTSGDNGSKMPTTYGTLDAGVLGVSQGSAPPGPDVGSRATGGGPDLGGAGGASRGGGAVTGGTSSLSGGLPYQAPAGQVPADGRTVASDAAWTPPAGASGYGPNVPQQGGPGGAYGAPGPYGVPGGYGNNTGYRGATPSGGRSAAGRFGAGGGSYGRGGSIGSGAGGARGFGPGGSGGNPLSEGKRFGAGNSAAGESFARGGAAGRPGSAGSPGGVGAGGGNRGKGEDDAEHQRKYIVDEDEHFQLTAEGEKAVDPITGMTVSPPVLGQ
ncbi:hypothetical protein [Amycolatopsis thermophila]|uniref:PPE family protein n=1 Tax=Amycolatopsis thermophila TaxID=206084 RepID=A0ABU0EW11_9PSEU|nr:hypothetical protein [Amycolatopsis thermophila]MDQ0378997.1 hypothetical protein [Amycolatopsis thermophila]